MVDMKKNRVWLQMEYKRAAVMLPLILKRAILLMVVCLIAASMIVMGVTALQGHCGEETRLKVGYTAEENQITALAVAYIQSMESFKSLCSLEAVSEEEGRQLLQDGELSALIVLPLDVINEILSGSNAPAILYLPEKGGSAVGDILFEELAAAGIGMLGTAQAEIYAADAILRELSAEYGSELFQDGLLQSMYDDINRFNLEAAASREKLFQKKTLSLTENDTYVVYYGSALFTIYVMFAGLFFGKFCKRSSLQQTMADRRVGVHYTAQLAARCLAGCALMAVVVVLPFLVLPLLELILELIPESISQTGSVLTITVTWQGISSLCLIICLMTVYFMMIYQIVEKRESALVVMGILAVVQAYLSGCLIPSVLLPKAVASVGKFLPAAMVKKGFTILFTGDTQAFSYVAAGICVWGLCLFLCTVLSMYVGEWNKSAADTKTVAKIRVPSLVMVLFRRLLHRKSMWISLGMIVVLSAVIMKVEQSSQTQIRVAVCDQSGDYADLLKAYDGLVLFEQYESDEAVQSAVLKGDVECGYVLPETLAENMMRMRADREILVYQDADAVAVPVVNEILFERIFRQVSLCWFEDYIAQNSAIKELGIADDRLRKIAEDCFDQQLLAGTTFHFEIRRLDDRAAGSDERDTDDGKRTVYPVYAVAVIAVFLCALQGILQVITDVREQNFYKRNRLAVSALTLLLPLLMGVLCAFLIITAAI